MKTENGGAAAGLPLLSLALDVAADISRQSLDVLRRPRPLAGEAAARMGGAHTYLKQENGCQGVGVPLIDSFSSVAHLN